MTDTGILDWEESEVFTVRVYKRLASRPDRVWANTYELRNTGNVQGTGAGQGRDLALIIAGWESSFHLSDVQFDRAVFSTHREDGQPLYNPVTFTSVDLTGVFGLRPLNGAQPMPLQACLLARRLVEYGRNGRSLYRRVLVEEDVQSPGGDPALTAGALQALTVLMEASEGNTSSLTALVEQAGAELVLAGTPGPGAGIVARRVLQVQPTGVVIKKYNNRYFDRARAVRRADRKAVKGRSVAERAADP